MKKKVVVEIIDKEPNTEKKSTLKRKKNLSSLAEVVEKKQKKEVLQELKPIKLFKGKKPSSNFIALDYGSSMSIFSNVSRGFVDCKEQFPSTVTFYYNKQGELQCKNLLKCSTSLKNTPVHLKSRIGLGKRQVSTNTTLINNKNEEVDLDSRELVKVAFKHYLKDQNVNIQEDEKLLLSCPNNYSHNELMKYRSLFEDVVGQGNVFCYYESEAALFNNLYDMEIDGKLFPGNYLIIDQGDSTTNCSIAIVKESQIDLRHFGLTWGGKRITDVVESLARAIDDHLERFNYEEYEIMRVQEFPKWKIDILNSKDMKLKFLINQKSYTIDTKTFNEKCEDIYKELNSSIDKFLKENDMKDKIDSIIFTGGSMQNQHQLLYLKNNVFKDCKDKVSIEGFKNHVVKGLHFRHLFETINSKMVIERSPYNLYTVIKEGKQKILICVLKKGEISFKSTKSILINNPGVGKDLYFPLVQVDEEEIQKLDTSIKSFDVLNYGNKLNSLSLIRIGKLQYNNQVKKTVSSTLEITFHSEWKSKNIDFNLYLKETDYKYEATFDFENSFDLELTFGKLQKDNKILE